MVKKNKESGRLLSIDLLRVFAIICVIGFHFLYEIYQSNSLRKIGFLGISLFFIISGYVLAKNYPKQTKFSIKWFVKRFVKIASLYYLAVILIVFLFGTQTYSGNIKDILLHFVFLDPLSSSAAYSIISPAWFLTPLLGLYLFFPYLNKYVKETKFLIIAFFLMTIFRTLNGTYTSYSPLFFLGEFCFGIAFAHENKHHPMVIALITLFIDPIMAVSYFLFYFVYHIRVEKEYFVTKVLHFIGINTFAFFLFHEAFIKVGFNKWHIFNLSMFWEYVILIFATILTSIFAYYIQKFIDKKFNL